MPENNNMPAKTEFLIYQTSDGRVRIETRLQRETVWLNQKQMAELFQTSVPNINMHIKNIFDEQDLMPDSVIQEFLITADDGKSYRTKHFIEAEQEIKQLESKRKRKRKDDKDNE